MTADAFKEIAPSLPHLPGVYKYYDAQKALLYIGKAKDIRKRVSSYFYKSVKHRKTQVLVGQIQYIEFTVTESEHDAFLLESSLIKHFQPRYNIELKDDKSFPYIVIKKERFPRVFFTRSILKDGSEYLGPYTSVFAARELLELIKHNIPLRNCTLNLSANNIERGKFKVCLEYHLGNCKGPCEGLQDEVAYNDNLQQVRHILKGNVSEVVKALKDEMQSFASSLQFEKAEIVRQKIQSLQQYQQKSVVVNPRLRNIDVITIEVSEGLAYVNFMMLHEGAVIYTNSLTIHKKIDDEQEEEMLALAYMHFYEKLNSKATEVLSSISFALPKPHMLLTIPKSGDKKHLVEMSLKNLNVFKETLRKKSTLLLAPATREVNRGILENLQKALKMSELPMHIECFDNSNFQGAYPVSAMVCFKYGEPSKQDYRHFKVKTVEGIDDFATMSEVVYRRYARLVAENVPLPQLVIIDGGKGQLGAALESLHRLGLIGRMTVVGLAKKEESIFFPGDRDPLQLPYDSPEHLLVRRIRDEVHRFGIIFHRQLRSKGTIKNELEQIPGIGSQLATALLREFRSVNVIKSLTERELSRIIGASKAAIVYRYFQDSK